MPIEVSGLALLLLITGLLCRGNLQNLQSEPHEFPLVEAPGANLVIMGRRPAKQTAAHKDLVPTMKASRLWIFQRLCYAAGADSTPNDSNRSAEGFAAYRQHLGAITTLAGNHSVI